VTVTFLIYFETTFSLWSAFNNISVIIEKSMTTSCV